MRIVLDTNVLVAGLLSPFGTCGEIVRMVSSGELELCLDARILSEYGEILRRPKFRFNDDAIAALLDYITYRGHMVASSPLLCTLPDPDDEMFLEITLAGQRRAWSPAINSTSLQHFVRVQRFFLQVNFYPRIGIGRIWEIMLDLVLTHKRGGL